MEEHTFCPLAFDVMVGAAAATLEPEEERVPEEQPLDWVWLPDAHISVSARTLSGCLDFLFLIVYFLYYF